jgi:amino acid adenylation domain-containing protein
MRAVERYARRPAGLVDGRSLTFAELGDRSAAIAATLQRRGGDGPPLTAVLASRSEVAFTGVVGALWRGHGYVPLNPALPVRRTREMLGRAGCRELVADAASAEQLPELLEGLAGLTIVLPDAADIAGLAARLASHSVVGAREMRPADDCVPAGARPDDVAYLLFTSGSTGTPKGVAVTQANARAFVDVNLAHYGIEEDDRIALCAELTFDASVFDLFVGWEAGACVCCVPRHALINPGSFIREAGVTIWDSVPSIASFMRRLGAAKPGAYPGVRLTLFGGEALTADLARDWARATPNGIVENTYGPTEATVHCLAHTWDPESGAHEAVNGMVPIGRPLAGTTAIVVDARLREVAPGDDGELLVSGPQVVPGYWEDPGRTAEAFVVPPGRSEVFYRTGDRVRAPSGDGPVAYLDRIDNQIQVLGNRVELGEVEAALRDVPGVDEAAAVGWPPTPGGAGGLVAFAAGPAVDPARARALLADRLPDYMLPRAVIRLDSLPRGASGKLDRRALVRLLEADRA